MTALSNAFFRSKRILDHFRTACQVLGITNQREAPLTLILPPSDGAREPGLPCLYKSPRGDPKRSAGKFLLLHFGRGEGRDEGFFRLNRYGLGIILAASFAITKAHGDGIIPTSSIPVPKKAAIFFGLTNVWTIHLEVSQADWSAMERSLPGLGPVLRMRGPAGQVGPAYVTARVEIAGQKFEKAGLRFKGHSSLMTSRGSLKRPFKIDFNRFEKGQKFLGMSKINLNNNAMDPSQIREALSYNIFRMAGIPASRTAFARVYLSVPEMFNQRYLGLYTVVEQVNGSFLEDRFGSKEGLLVKPESGLRYRGEDWSAYRRPYEAKNEPTPEDASRFIQFIKLVASGDEEYFRSHLEEFTDVDQFLRFLAVTVAIADMDSVLGMNHNFYLFQRAQTKKIAWIPWDLNLSLGTGMGGEHGVELSIGRPAPSQSQVIEWILKDEKWFKLYKGHLQSLLDSALRPERLLRLVEQLRSALREPIALESPRSLEQFESSVLGPGTNTVAQSNPDALLRGQPGRPPEFRVMANFGWPGMGVPLTKWLPARAESIAAQLAGRSEGRPASMRGPGEMQFMGPAGLAERFLRNTGLKPDAILSAPMFKEAAGKWFQRLDTDRSGALSESEAAVAIGPEFGPRPEVIARLPVPPGPSPRAFGSTPFGSRWFRRIDADGNTIVSSIEWAKAFRNWFD
jgi:spore coat protein H